MGFCTNQGTLNKPLEFTLKQAIETGSIEKYGLCCSLDLLAFLERKNITDRSVPIASHGIEEGFTFFLLLVSRIAITHLP